MDAARQEQGASICCHHSCDWDKDKGLTAENAKTAENKDIIRNAAYSAVSAVNKVCT
jgi:hypothetical protein